MKWTQKKIYASKPWLKYYPEGVPETVTYHRIHSDRFDQAVREIGKQDCFDLYGKKDQLRKAEE